MHTSLLAFESPAIASVASLVFAMIIVYAYLLRLYTRRALLQALGWAGFSIYFGLLAVSAGTNPQIDRGQIVLFVRVVLLATYTVFAMWGVLWMRELLRHRLE